MALLQDAQKDGELEQVAISDPAKATTEPVAMETTDPVHILPGDPYPYPYAPPPEGVVEPADTGDEPVGGEGGRPSGPTTVQDLYPTAPEGQEMEDITVGEVEGADVTEADIGVGEVGTPGVAETETGDIIEGAVGEVGGAAEAAQAELTAEQQVDAELARILGQDSPLLAQARAEAMRMAGARGLMNSSMAAGMTYGEMVKAALPMAQQNAQQAAARVLENARMRQESGLFTAEQISRLRSLEAELGQELSIFNADQLNQAERLSAELRTAIEQGNAQAYNEAALQLAELQRDAQAQQAEIDYASAEREFLEQQAYNEQIIEQIGELNRQYMIGEQNVDIQHIVGTYDQLISTNESAARIFEQYINSIGSIFDDPKMSSGQAAEAIGAMVNMLEASMRMLSEMNGIDFGDIEGTIPGGAGGGGGGGGGRRGGRGR